MFGSSEYVDNIVIIDFKSIQRIKKLSSRPYAFQNTLLQPCVEKLRSIIGFSPEIIHNIINACGEYGRYIDQ